MRSLGEIRVLLGEDHAVVRQGTRKILEQDGGIEVVGEASTGPEVVSLAARLAPDVVLLDLSLPILNGVEAARRIRAAAGQPPRVLILSAYDDEDYVVAAMEAGANGYLLKTAHADDVLAAIRAVARGEVVLDPSLAQRLFARDAETGGRSPLAPAELEILRLAARGFRTKEISDTLSVSPRTVEARFTSIFNKLGVSSRTEAIVHSAARGWIRLEGEPHS